MRKMRSKTLALLVAVVFAASMFALGVPTAGANGCPMSEVSYYPLYADQDVLVGTVEVANCIEHLHVKYVLSPEAIAEGWGIIETHTHVTTDPALFPMTKTGNPIPGKFEDSSYWDMPGVTMYEFIKPLGELGAYDDVFVAAHAVISRTECVTLATAPYAGSEIIDYEQGLRKDGTAVREGRSDPTAVLTWDTNRLETDFFSLGFGGSITIGFDCCITNGDGPDVMIVEDTWGTYPLESAVVWASEDGWTWVELGDADNVTRDTTYPWQTVSLFDLGELECAHHIVVNDTTDPAPLPADADGFDLNTVVALHDCVECTTYTESAWAAMDEPGTIDFPGANWATYISYVVKPILVQTVQVPSNGTPVVSASLMDGMDYKLKASGTYKFANWATAEYPELGYADAEYSLRPPGQSYSYHTELVPTWVSGDDIPAPYTSYLEVKVNGTDVAWGAFNPEHIYYTDVLGDGGALSFQILDNYYGDNSGFITVEIWAMP